MLLVAFTVVNLFLHGLSLFDLFLKSDEPARAISSILDLKGMLLSMGSEDKFICALLGHTRSIALESCELSTLQE